jgi:uncharacterized coiled-coil protein SlyX
MLNHMSGMAAPDAVSQFASRLETIEQRIAELGAKVDSLSSVSSSQEAEIANLTDLVTALATRQRAITVVQSEQTVFIDESVRRLREKNRRLRIDVAQIKGQLKTLLPSIPQATAVVSAEDPSIVTLRFSEETPLSGILSYLTDRHGGNVHDLGIVEITAVKPYDDDPDYAPKNAADIRNTESRFFSASGKNQSISFDFKQVTVTPTHYSIRNGQFGNDLQTWRIEGSLDGVEWKVLDERTGIEELAGEGVVASFQIATRERVRIIKLVQTAPAQDCSNQFTISAFEIFGDLHG